MPIPETISHYISFSIKFLPKKDNVYKIRQTINLVIFSLKSRRILKTSSR